MKLRYFNYKVKIALSKYKNSKIRGMTQNPEGLLSIRESEHSNVLESFQEAPEHHH